MNIDVYTHYADSSTAHLEPADPFCAQLLQMSALKDLGYPVDIELVPVSQLPDSFYDDDITAYEASRWRTWFRPVVDPKFEPYIEILGDAGEVAWSSETAKQNRMASHVAQVTSYVDIAEPSVLAGHLSTGGLGGLVTPLYFADGSKASDELIGSCFVRALERSVELEEAGVPLPGYIELTDATFRLYDILQRRRIGAIDAERLGGLVYDYYHLAEEINPTFRSFKGSHPPAHTI